MKLLIDELIHFILALGIGLGCYLKFDNSWLIFVALIFGFLIDVDHLFDYFAYFGARFKLKDFLNTNSYMKSSGKIFVLLHGWEYVLLFWLIGHGIDVAGLDWAMSLSYLAHLFWDNFSFSHHPLTYFLTYRLINKFSVKKLIAKT